jgi:hypothetical protein
VKKIILIAIFLVFMAVGMAHSADILIGTFEVGALLPELNMQYRGHNGKNLFLYDPLDEISPDGIILVMVYSGKYILVLDGVTYTFVPATGSRISLYRR